MAHKKGPNTKPMTKEDKDVLIRYGQLIREYRRVSPYSRVELCKILDISNSQLSAWETGKAEPRLHSVLKLCGLLHIPLEELLYNIDSLNLSIEESRLIKAVRKLTPAARNFLLQFIESLVSITEGSSENSVAVDEPSETDVYATDGSFTISSESGQEAIILDDDFDIEEPDVPSRPALIEEIEQPKRKRGRPRIHPLPDPNAVKRGRGRPKKLANPPVADEVMPITDEYNTEQPAEIPTEAEIAQPTEPLKRKRGRPRKTPLPAETAGESSIDGTKEPVTEEASPALFSEETDQPKKKRGRPRKQQS